MATVITTAPWVTWRGDALAVCSCGHPRRDHNGVRGCCLWCGCES